MCCFFRKCDQKRKQNKNKRKAIGNSRNGSFSKINVGNIVLNIPRDGNGEFEPQIIPKIVRKLLMLFFLIT